MNRVCVFAGSNPGASPAYLQAADQLGKEIVSRGLELVYGGSKNGLMGQVANTVMNNGGKAIGVMPTGLFQGEIVHHGLTELYEVSTMHERKAKMYEMADAFIALPGGMGTFEEIFEVLSWSQIGIHEKPIGLLNTNAFYTPLEHLIKHAISAKFAKENNLRLFIMSDDPAELLEGCLTFQRPQMQNKWNLA